METPVAEQNPTARATGYAAQSGGHCPGALQHRA
jgi:hypothetical protein